MIGKSEIILFLVQAIIYIMTLLPVMTGISGNLEFFLVFLLSIFIPILSFIYLLRGKSRSTFLKSLIISALQLPFSFLILIAIAPSLPGDQTAPLFFYGIVVVFPTVIFVIISVFLVNGLTYLILKAKNSLNKS